MDQVREAYGSIADEYREAFGTIASMHVDDLAFIDRHLAQTDGIVLDLGCGPGHLTEHLRLCHVDARGIDLVPEFVDHARTSFPHGDYSVASMSDLPFDDSSVAGALAWFSLIHHTPAELDGAVAELDRVLAPGGTLVVGFFAGAQVAPFAHRVTTAYTWPVDELVGRLRRLGWNEIDRCVRDATTAYGPRTHAAIAMTKQR